MKSQGYTKFIFGRTFGDKVSFDGGWDWPSQNELRHSRRLLNGPGRQGAGGGDVLRSEGHGTFNVERKRFVGKENQPPAAKNVCEGSTIIFSNMNCRS